MNVKITLRSDPFHGLHDRLVPEQVELVIDVDELPHFNVASVLARIDADLQQHAMNHAEELIQKKLDKRITEMRDDAR